MTLMFISHLYISPASEETLFRQSRKTDTLFHGKFMQDYRCEICFVEGVIFVYFCVCKLPSDVVNAGRVTDWCAEQVVCRRSPSYSR